MRRSFFEGEFAQEHSSPIKKQKTIIEVTRWKVY